MIEHARDRGDLETLRTYASASADTVVRMLASDRHGGWTGPRITGIRAYEEQVVGGETIRRAMVGAEIASVGGSVEVDADQLQAAALAFASELARMRPDGLSRPELRALLRLLPNVEARLARFRRDARASLEA